MIKSAYTYPELAAYIQKLVARNPLWESEVEYITRMAVEKTKHEMLDAGTLIKKENRLELPPPPARPVRNRVSCGVKNRIKGHDRFDRYTAIEKANRQVIQEMINHGDLAPEQLPPPVKDNVVRVPRKPK